MKKLDRYIVKKFIGTFFFFILLISIISIVIDYSEKVEDFVSKKAPFLEIVNYYKNFIPHITALLFPIFIFLATIYFTSRLAYRSEIIAILASGVSFTRLLWPFIVGALLLCGMSFAANHWIVPEANKQRLAFEDKYVHSAAVASDEDTHLRLSKDLYVFVHTYDYRSNVGYTFSAETIKGTTLTEKVTADRITYDSVKNNWKLFNVTIRTNDSLKETLTFYPELEKNYPFKPMDLKEDDAIKEALNTHQLNTYIAREKLRGSETLNAFYIEKHRRTSEPFAGLILTIIGVCIASRKIRGGTGVHLVLGIALNALYVMSMQITKTFATNASLDPLIAVWIPNFFFSILAGYLLYKKIKTT